MFVFFIQDGGNSGSVGGSSSVPGAGGSHSNGASGSGNGGSSSRLGVREVMQRAVTAARSASSSLAGLDVEEDAQIPTLHWPPDPPGKACSVTLMCSSSRLQNASTTNSWCPSLAL